MRGPSLALWPAVALAALLSAGCACCSTDLPYTPVHQGDPDGVDFQDLKAPVCERSSCNLKLDVVNSYRRVVRVLWEGDPDVDPVPDPVNWDLEDDEGNLVPEDTYIMRAWLDNERLDSWIVFVYE